MLSYSTIKSVFINLEDNAWEDNIPTKQAVESFLNNKSHIENYIAMYKDDLAEFKDDLERYEKNSETFLFLIPKMRKDIAKWEKQITELSNYVLANFTFKFYIK